MSNKTSIVLNRRSILMAGISSALYLTTASLTGFAANPGAAAAIDQPLLANIRRIIDALHRLGEPLAQNDEKLILSIAQASDADSLAKIEKILAKYTLLNVRLTAHGTGTLISALKAPTLVEQGWRCFLMRVENPFNIAAPLVLSGQLIAEGQRPLRLPSASIVPALGTNEKLQVADYAERWMGYSFFSAPPFSPALSGLAVEYRIIQIYSRDRGFKKALVAINTPFEFTGMTRAVILERLKNTGTSLTFNCLPALEVSLQIKDWDGAGCMAALLLKDEAQRIYPAPAHRLAPDLDFQAHVYRADGETLRLPPGRYEIVSSRGPEYIRTTQTLTIERTDRQAHCAIQLQRWINPAVFDWYSGDVHIHAAGCAHYENPTLGVTPETIVRQVRGEALAIGDVLIWSPGYYYQKQFFSGQIYQPLNRLEYPDLQRANNTSLQPRATPRDSDSAIRYDLEISGFPSSHSGHLVLLGLREQTYPNAERIENWPSWNLPILQWAKAQGAVVGYAHSSIGLDVNVPTLPNYEIPLFNSIGANEFLIDLAHDAVDFIAGGELDPIAELNMWYHTLNCGFRAVMIGETDFPCISDNAVGAGRTYVQLDQPPRGDAGYAAWIAALRAGRLYFGDGRSHFIDYRIDGHNVDNSGFKLKRAGKIVIETKIAAYLDVLPATSIPALPLWHLEYARIDQSRNVAVEVVVNGSVVLRKEILADGELRDFAVEIAIAASSWVALRILPSGHTSPIFIEIADQPIRAARRSAQWCLDCIEAIWNEKRSRIATPELADAAAAYAHARNRYRKILDQCA